MTKSKIVLALAGTLAVWGGLNASAQDASSRQDQTPTSTAAQPQSGAMPGMMGTVDQQFVMRAAQDNLAEVQVGQLALQKSQNEDVKRIAQHLVQEHGKANDELRQIATSKGMPFPTDTDPIHKGMAEMLAKLSGAEFDRKFIDAQNKDHVAAINLFEQQAMLGSDPELKSYARRYLRPIRGHTGEIQRVAQRIGVPHLIYTSYPLAPMGAGSSMTMMPSAGAATR